MDTDILLRQCLQRATRVLPKPMPTIYDLQDELSDFAYGLVLGLRKMKQSWSDEKRVEYLVSNAVYHVRAKRFKAMRKGLILTCKRGHPIPRNKDFNGFGTVRPCCGEREEMTVSMFVTCFGDYTLTQLSEERIKVPHVDD
jgi:hypothetical protein